MRFGRPKPPPYRPPRDRTPTDQIPEVGVVRPVAPRTAPIPLPATYPNALPPELERVAEAFTLTAQGRLSGGGLFTVLTTAGGPWYQYPVSSLPMARLRAAQRYLARWESHYAPLIEGPCPPGMRCPEGAGLCPWHRKILRQWFDRLHPVVRAAADPATFEATVAPLLTDLPTRTEEL